MNMSPPQSFLIPSLLLIVITSLVFASFCGAAAGAKREAYIVYLGEKHEHEDLISLKHANMLERIVSGDEVGSNLLMHSYKRSFDGFAAMLTKEEARQMGDMDGVVSVFPNRMHKLHTTRSWDFIGFSNHVQRATKESDIIVGILDTGIWPEAKSFSDEGFGPPPKKWKGSCHGTNFTCNNKLIGAKYWKADGNFTGEIQSPRDTNGHGTHTASTVAGNAEESASLYGLGYGTARGGVPSARIAAYKVCWESGCTDADILAGFDEAIADGVDIISISAGAKDLLSHFFEDPVSIGSFHAMRRGILTSQSAGNYGPKVGTTTSFAPWALSVAASSIDRKFVTRVVSGNGKIYEGVSVNTFNLSNRMYPVIAGKDAPNLELGVNGSISKFCIANSLDPQKVRGKIVLCELLDTGEGPFIAGAAGYVTGENGMPNKDLARTFPLPASYLSADDVNAIARDPQATIQKSIQMKDTQAPYVASFSSRGPNVISSDVLKPDITAPGVLILAAWTLLNPVSEIKGDNRFVPYNIISGTSMACPHVSGAVAYVKSFHPHWSPAAIKSALMTTARPMSPVANPGAEFAYGSGNLDPVKALNPGLVYDASESDYVNFLCNLGYNTMALRMITGDKSACTGSTKGRVWDLNYPSISLPTPTRRLGRAFWRTVTNVGPPSKYVVKVTAPKGVDIRVSPRILHSDRPNQKRTFEVVISGEIGAGIASGSLIWDDGAHQVRIPIVIWDSS
ncbi:hypothetical protein MLD38_036958 [Melastoma candidum]|uniref:Uncharacterized protein n=1 Tax=Melastoma candidum TaxID=119954 RepID=A0ACB9LL44_9MYRT|nr:hypothetical protein MLD38_036958 [Melastoma candidum]